MKPGVQTSEFRLTVATLLGNLGAALGGAISPRVSSYIAAGVVVAYTFCRSFLKASGSPDPSQPTTASGAS